MTAHSRVCEICWDGEGAWCTPVSLFHLSLRPALLASRAPARSPAPQTKAAPCPRTGHRQRWVRLPHCPALIIHMAFSLSDMS